MLGTHYQVGLWGKQYMRSCSGICRLTIVFCPINGMLTPAVINTGRRKRKVEEGNQLQRGRR